MLDVNDNPPTFVTSSCHKFISDDTQVGTNVFTGSDLSATDPDLGINSELQYKLANSDFYFPKYFSFTELIKSVKVTNDLDLGQQNITTSKVVNFTIFVQDKGTPSFNSSIDCSMTITGVNQFSPVFSHESILNVRVPLNSQPGYRVAKINATDKDIGPDGELQYQIASGNDGNTFSVSNDGTVSLLKALAKDCYFLNINVSDKASASKRKYSILTIAIFHASNACPNTKIYVNAYESSTMKVSKNTSYTVPIYAHIGNNYLEGVDVTLTYTNGISLVGTTTSDYYVYPSSNTIRIVGLSKMTQLQFGIMKIAEMKLTSTINGVVTFNATQAYMYTQDGSDVSVTPLRPQTCQKVVFGDVDNDCRLTLLDAAFCQSYIRESILGFTSSYASRFTSLTSEKKGLLDANKNEVVDAEDAKYMLDVLVGKTVAISQVAFAPPNEAAKLCQLTISATVDPTVGAYQGSYEVYALITFNAANGNPVQSSTSKMANFTNLLISGEVLKFVKSGNVLNIGVDVMKTSQQFGVTLIVVTNDYILNMAKKNPSSNTVNVNIPNALVKISKDFEAQQNVALDLTTYYCNNVRATVRIGLKFTGDYDTVVKGKEADFETKFRAFHINKEWTENNRTIEIVSFTVSKGSIVVEMDVLVLASETQDMQDELSKAVSTGQYSFLYNSGANPVTLTADKTLMVNGVEQARRPAESDDDTTVIIIVVVVVIVLLIAIGLLYFYCRKRMKQQLKTKVADIGSAVSVGESSNGKAGAHEIAGYDNIVYDDKEKEVEKETEFTIEEVNLKSSVPNSVVVSAFF